jgi:hypothetical protein
LGVVGPEEFGNIIEVIYYTFAGKTVQYPVANVESMMSFKLQAFFFFAKCGQRLHGPDILDSKIPARDMGYTWRPGLSTS